MTKTIFIVFDADDSKYWPIEDTVVCIGESLEECAKLLWQYLDYNDDEEINEILESFRETGSYFQFSIHSYSLNEVNPEA